jgi:hypothetical protein
MITPISKDIPRKLYNEETVRVQIITNIYSIQR